MKLRFTARALTDLKRLRAFIANENQLASRRVIDALRRSMRHLVNHPHMGVEIDHSTGLRQWASGDYVVRYLPDDQVVIVIRIWHGKEQRPGDSASP